ncbi:kinase-like domain-containing protein [Aspergillus stella-maris]|uniref:kinase-like domain-containing protein n=1 Tax=Aspergillus stella-maris TaxID=1810926 RepID=UPI003CCCE7CF
MVEEVEHPAYYVTGGYHPVKLGDEYCFGRYKIVAKLGFGRSATTWLAEDKENPARPVSIKILTAESVDIIFEQRILEQLTRAAESDPTHPGKDITQTLLDSFMISGPNGTHRCLVTEVERVTLNLLKDYPHHRILPLPVARVIAAQLIHGVQFIHDHGIDHGDLHFSNILLQLSPAMKNMNSKQLLTKTLETRTEQVIREDGAPLDPGVSSELIVPIHLGPDHDKMDLTDARIRIVDFSESFDPVKDKQYESHAPTVLAPPESRFTNAGGLDEPLSFSADVWTLGCAIWEIFGGGQPFDAFPPTPDEVTKEHAEMLGKLPQRWWTQWEERRKWFNEDGTKNVRENLGRWYSCETLDWNSRFQWYIMKPRKSIKKVGIFSVEEERAFRDMISLMLVFEPAKRGTIERVVGCEWMTRWGIAEVEKMREGLGVGSWSAELMLGRGFMPLPGVYLPSI